MTRQHLPQLFATLIAVATPLMVVQVARLVAAHHAASLNQSLPVSRRFMRPLLLATLAASIPALAAAMLLPVPSLMLAVVNLATFAVLAVVGLRALATLDRATRPIRLNPTPVREASLAPRRLSDYLARPVRPVPFLVTSIGVAAFAVRAVLAAAPREWPVPGSFAAASVAFLWLYEVWMRDLVAGPITGREGDEDARRRSIRLVFMAELVLTTSCLVVAHGLLDLNWNRHPGMGAALSFTGALVAIVGCALALASGLAHRTYVMRN
jgi:hypothetical protein